MKKTILILALILLAFCISAENKKQNNPAIPDTIINSVVMVGGSSGIVIYSNAKKALILTAKHIIYNKTIFDDEILVNTTTIDRNLTETFQEYRINNIELYDKADLAIIEIEPYQDSISTVAKKDPNIGDDIWVACNPNGNFRSLKKGIISSKSRIFNNKRLYWEVSGGSIFGSSGGGIFNMDGDLVAIMSGVDRVPIGESYLIASYIGYVVPLAHIKEFLINSQYKNIFKYLAEEE